MNKTEAPVFTIITVVYNDAKNLRKTLSSVSAQQYTRVQFIIIDGGSTDNTVEVIRANQTVISCWKSEKDNGIYDAMNKGLTMARGDYVNFLNAGDTFHDPHVLERVAQEVSRTQAEIIYGKALHKSNIPGGVDYVRGKNITPDMLFRNVPFCHQALFVRSTLFHEIGHFDLTFKVVADYEWMISYYNKKKTINGMHFIDDIIVDYDTDGFSFKNILTGVTEKVRIANKSFKGKYFLTGNIYFFLDKIRVRIVIALHRVNALQSYRKLKYDFFKRLSIAKK